MGAFMGNDVPELPQFGSIFILLLDVIEDLIVGENFLILVIIDEAAQLEPFSTQVQSSLWKQAQDKNQKQ